MFKCLRIGQGIAVGYRAPVDHFPDCQFDNFAADRAWNFRHLGNHRRDMAGRGTFTDRFADSRL